MFYYLELILKLFLSSLFAGFLGFEREKIGRSAGIRTFAMVSLGSVLYTILSQKLFNDFLIAVNNTTVASSLGFDPSRILSQIIVGVGFLGAGVIIHQGQKVVGLTTAASLWVSAGIGAAIGMGFYLEAFITACFAMIILHGVRYLTKKDEGEEHH